MDRHTELPDTVAYLQAELENIHNGAADRSLTPEEQTAFDDGVFVRDAAIAEGIQLEARQRSLDSVKAGDLSVLESGDSLRDRGAPNIIVGDKDPYDERYQRDVGTREVALRAIGECRQVGGDEKTEMEHKLKTSASDSHMRGFDEYLLRHNSETYSRGLLKLISGRSWEMLPEEVDAVRRTQAWDESRALSLTAANGGALIPAHLDSVRYYFKLAKNMDERIALKDYQGPIRQVTVTELGHEEPTVLLTNAGTSNPYRAISRVVPMITSGRA